jgi:hypothetical protein
MRFPGSLQETAAVAALKEIVTLFLKVREEFNHDLQR